MSEMKPLTELEICRLAHQWYYNLNTHAPIEEFLQMLAPEGLTMIFPETTLQGIEQFKEWHKTVTNQFFNQDHNIKFLETKINGTTAHVRVIVRWQAHTWKPPAAKSSWLGYDAYQSWVVERAQGSGKPVIKKYAVDAFMPMEGTN